jgi:dTDP-4-dehydrorhamnose reductase
MKTLLITGVSGFLGWNICHVARDKWNVVGTVNTRDASIDGVKTFKCDLANAASVRALFAEVRPGAVIHAAAAADPNFCQKNPEQARRINVNASITIAGLCAECDIPCAFTSTDLVFDGTMPPYKETDPACPINSYGQQKIEAERVMRSINPKMVICRMPLMFGDAPPNAKSFIQPFINALMSGKELKLFIDEYRTPVAARDAAAGILLMLHTMPDIVHLGGKQRISRYEFGMLLAMCLGISNPSIIPSKRKDVVMAAPRSPDVSFNSTKAFGLGYNPELPEAALKKLECVHRSGH